VPSIVNAQLPASVEETSKTHVGAVECKKEHSQPDERSTPPTRVRSQLRPARVDAQNAVFELRRLQAAARREERGLKVALLIYCDTFEFQVQMFFSRPFRKP
jgi:hypothetical protein